MAKHDEWLSRLITTHNSITIENIQANIEGIGKASPGTVNHPAVLAGAMHSSVLRKIEDVGLASVAELIDTDHKKAVLYGMLHQSDAATTRLVRRPSISTAGTNILRHYLVEFIHHYTGFASAGEQSIMKSGPFDIEPLRDGGAVMLRRVPSLDASTRLRYQAKISSRMNVIRVLINDGHVSVGLKLNLSFSDFYGISSEAMRSTRFTDDAGALTSRGASLFALTKPLLQDLMLLTQVLKTIRRVQYERDL